MAEFHWGCGGQYRLHFPVSKVQEKASISFFPCFFPIPFLEKKKKYISSFPYVAGINVLLEYLYEFGDLVEWEGCMSLGEVVFASGLHCLCLWLGWSQGVLMWLSWKDHCLHLCAGWAAVMLLLSQWPGCWDTPFLFRLILHLIMIYFNWIWVKAFLMHKSRFIQQSEFTLY